MWLIVGLGNPGARYAKTRHNVGFLVVGELVSRSGMALKERADCNIVNGSISGEEVVLMEPLTFMNRSGSAVKRIMDKYAPPQGRLIVVHDDLDMGTGKLKIRKSGSSGGHKGVESIIQSIGTNDFIRVKIGIGRDPFMAVEDFVLSKFSKDEVPLIKKAVINASDAVEMIIIHGVEKAMNEFN